IQPSSSAFSTARGAVPHAELGQDDRGVVLDRFPPAFCNNPWYRLDNRLGRGSKCAFTIHSFQSGGARGSGHGREDSTAVGRGARSVFDVSRGGGVSTRRTLTSTVLVWSLAARLSTAQMIGNLSTGDISVQGTMINNIEHLSLALPPSATAALAL